MEWRHAIHHSRFGVWGHSGCQWLCRLHTCSGFARACCHVDLEASVLPAALSCSTLSASSRPPTPPPHAHTTHPPSCPTLPCPTSPCLSCPVLPCPAPPSTCAQGNLLIAKSDKLDSLKGLEHLSSVGGNLVIDSNLKMEYSTGLEVRV